MSGVHDFSPRTIDGAELDLGSYAGKVLLLVNVASKCGLTPQYAGLEALHREYAPRGFSVVGFPCNQFLGQEPGTEEEIKTFCSTQYDVTFPLFGKVHVKDEDQHPLYAYLTTQPTEPDGPGDIAWNFAKFVIGKDGSVVARFSPKTEPNDAALLGAIERALAT